MTMYILDGKVPVRADIDAWERWRTADAEQRTVGKTTVSEGVTVSTVFLMLDHNFDGKGPPILFETMVFGGPLNEEQVRYVTWDEAERGHAEMVARVRAAVGSPALEVGGI